jgi:hypothetical protein
MHRLWTSHSLGQMINSASPLARSDDLADLGTLEVGARSHQDNFSSCRAAVLHHMRRYGDC